MADYNKREKYWWYRLVKAIFVILILFTLWGVGVFGWDARPQVDEYESIYRVQCNDNDLTFGQFTDDHIYIYSREIIDDDLEDVVKLRCVFPSLEPDFLLEEYRKGQYDKYVSVAKNYDLEISDPVIDGSWGTAFKVWIIGIIITFVIGYILLMLFNYIVFGNKPKNPFKT